MFRIVTRQSEGFKSFSEKILKFFLFGISSDNQHLQKLFFPEMSEWSADCFNEFCRPKDFSTRCTFGKIEGDWNISRKKIDQILGVTREKPAAIHKSENNFGLRKSENKFALHKSENEFALHKSENEFNPNPPPSLPNPEAKSWFKTLPGLKFRISIVVIPYRNSENNESSSQLRNSKKCSTAPKIN